MPLKPKPNPKRLVILEALRNGHTHRDACRAAGISRQLLHWWRKDPSFAAEMDIAEQVSIDSALAAIRAAWSGGNWTAAAWFLERRNPAEYGRGRDRLAAPTVTDDAVEPDGVVGTLDPEAVAAKARQILGVDA